MKLSRLTILLCILVLGCMPYVQSGLKPVNPSYSNIAVGNVCKPVRLPNLRPVLKWEPSEMENSSYDLIIYKAVRSQSGAINCAVRGEQAYSRDGLNETKHRVETALEPDTVYIWTVRAQKGNVASYWSYMKSSMPNDNSRYFYTFSTPEQ